MRKSESWESNTLVWKRKFQVSVVCQSMNSKIEDKNNGHVTELTFLGLKKQH